MLDVPPAARLAIVTLIVASAKWAFCDSRDEGEGCLLRKGTNGAAFILRGALLVGAAH